MKINKNSFFILVLLATLSNNTNAAVDVICTIQSGQAPYGFRTKMTWEPLDAGFWQCGYLAF